MKCPFCGHRRFYIKDPADAYETYGFSCETGEVCFDPGINASEVPAPEDDSHIYCEKCAWNGEFGSIK